MDEPSCLRQANQKLRREKFLEEILQSENKKSSHYNVLSVDDYADMVKQVEDAEKLENRTSLQKRRLKRFAVLKVGDVKKLIARCEGNIKYFLPADELYDVIDAGHVAVGHGGRDKMLAETSKTYANITKEMIGLYLSMCDVCQQKKPKKKRGLVSKPILHSEMISRCQVDLIDFQTQPDGNFKFIMVYQDHLTEFVLLRALKSKRAEEVAYHLNDIFLTVGAPCILQSGNGREFVNNVIRELASLWPELKIVHGKPRDSQSQGSVEHANQDIENMIRSWLKYNNSTKWSEGLRHVQFTKNRAYHSGIKQSPYKALFGIEPRVGLSTASLPQEIINDIQDEDDLRKAFEYYSNTEQYEDSADDDNIVKIDTNDIQNARKNSTENLENQAKRMKTTSDKSHPPANIGDNVIIPIPDVDKARGHLRNIIGVILQKTDKGLYKIGIKHGVLQKHYCRTDFDVCTPKFLDVGDINQAIEISLTH